MRCVLIYIHYKYYFTILNGSISWVRILGGDFSLEDSVYQTLDGGYILAGITKTFGAVTKFLEDFGRNLFNNPCPTCEVGAWCEYP